MDHDLDTPGRHLPHSSERPDTGDLAPSAASDRGATGSDRAAWVWGAALIGLAALLLLCILLALVAWRNGVATG